MHERLRLNLICVRKGALYVLDDDVASIFLVLCVMMTIVRTHKNLALLTHVINIPVELAFAITSTQHFMKIWAIFFCIATPIYVHLNKHNSHYFRSTQHVADKRLKTLGYDNDTQTYEASYGAI